MVKVHVKLYGTLAVLVADYRHEKGLEVNLTEGATIGDLLARLKIDQTRGAVVSANGRILSRDDTMSDGFRVKIFQTVHGG